MDCLLINEHRANQILKNVIPYMRYYVADRLLANDASDTLTQEEEDRIIDTYFTKAMLPAPRNHHWDADQDGIVTPFDPYLQEITKKQDMFDFTNTDEPIFMNHDPTTPYECYVIHLAQGADQDSITTFCLRNAAISTLATNSDMADVAAHTSPDAQSIRTTSSWQSMQSEFTKIVNVTLDVHLANFKTDITTEITSKIQKLLRNALTGIRPPGAVHTTGSHITPSTLATSPLGQSPLPLSFLLPPSSPACNDGAPGGGGGGGGVIPAWEHEYPLC